MRIALVGALALALMSSPIHASEGPVLRIDGKGDGGGEVETYRTILNWLRMLGARVEISAPCVSACVMVLRSFPEDRICVRPGARIGLHLVARPDRNGRPQYDPAMTKRFIAMFYPAWVAEWIAAHGPLKPTPVFVGYDELRRHYQVCV